MLLTFYLQLDDQFLRDVTAISSDLAQDFLGSQTLMGAESPIWSAGQLSSFADEGAGALRPGISGPFSWPVCTSRCRSPVRTARQTCGLSIAFVTEGSTVLRILKHIGQPTDPHKVSPVRGPTIWWEESEGQTATGAQALPSFNPLAQPEPEQPAGKPVCTAAGRPKGAAQGSAA